MLSRREFGASLAALLLIPGGRRRGIEHPDPRPGIDASGVMTAEQLKGLPDSVIQIFDQIREIPEIADGIGCNCGCAAMPTYRSLLTCYHETGMARGCEICQGEARLVYRRAKEGQSLEQIRRAIDARFG
ncbi:MAG: hypothetical protein HKN29_00915 [Rhodothermales bacterium]|nr:hypothetical protein [Rhodothermales bacterium]